MISCLWTVFNTWCDSSDASAAQSLESLNGAAEGLEVSWGLLPEARAWNLCPACPFGH